MSRTSVSIPSVADARALANLADPRLLAEFLARIPAPVAMFDQDLRYIAASGKWYEAYGLSDRDIIGRGHYEIFPEIPERWRDIHRRNLAGEEMSEDEDPFPRLDGSLDYVRWRNVPWFTSDGTIGGIIMFTEVVTREVEMRKAAEAAAAAKTRFLSAMSHEIRTPLNGILGILQMLTHRDLPQEAAKQIQIARRSGFMLLSLINQVLEFSKIESGRVELTPEPFSPAALIEDVQSMFENQAEAKRLEFTCHMVQKSDMLLVADQMRIRQILVNLVGNAIKFTKTGTVDVVARVRPGQDGVKTLQIEVTDTGPGIPPDEIGPIFEEFGQGKEGLDQGGTGLGLSICNRLAVAMGGAIAVRSTPGSGSTFTVTVPVGEPENAELTILPKGRSRSSGIALRVLVAEDNAVNQMILRSVLEAEGHAVTIAADGAEAVSILRDAPRAFDLVLMDVQMPVLDGVAATQLIRREIADDRTLPIIGVTANAFAEQKAEYRAAGMQDVVTKPVDLDQLSHAILQHCQPSPTPSAPQEDGPEADGGDAPESTLNLDRLNHYQKFMPAEVLEQMFDTVRQDSDRLTAEIEASTGNLDALCRTSHQLAGMLLNFGLDRAGAVARAIEGRGKSGEAPTRDAIADLRLAIDDGLEKAMEFIRGQ